MKKCILVVCVLILFSSCGSSKQRTSEKYIDLFLTEFNIELTNNQYCFVILPNFACGGCVSEVLLKIDFEEQYPNHHVICISSSSREDINVYAKAKFDNFYLDNGHVIDDYVYSFANIGILLIKDKQVYDAFNINTYAEYLKDEVFNLD